MTGRKEFFLTDRNYFQLFIGKRVLRSAVFNEKGSMPLYSANVFLPFGYVDKSNIKDFDKNYLLWGIDGIFDFNIIPRGTKFATTDHCGTIAILNEKFIPEYLLYQLKIQSHILGFDRSLRSSLKNMEKAVVSVPIDKNGEIDVKAQQDVVEKYRIIFKVKQLISKKLEDVENAAIDVPLIGKSENIVLERIFDFPETNSGITKEFCLRNKGTIPVYASSFSESSTLGYIKDNIEGIKYYEDSLAWNRNGSVGEVFYRAGRFSTNEDHRVLVIKDEYKKVIDLHYIKYFLEIEIKKAGFGFTNKLGKAKLKNLSIAIPLGIDGKFDIVGQIALARQYERIYGLKEKLIQGLRELKTSEVEV